MAAIKCRSRKAPSCYHGKPEEDVYGEDGQDSDGTWDGSSVVCDACYIGIGQPAVPITHPEARRFGASIEQGDPREGS